MVEAPSSPIKQLMFVPEVTWGTAVAATKDLGLVITDSALTWDREVMQSQGLGTIESQKITTGLVEPKLSLTGEFQHGRILEYAFGSVAHATSGTDEKHTFTIVEAAPSATFSSAFNLATDIDVTMAGMIVDSCEISSELNGKLMIATEWLGKTIATDTTAPSFTQSTLPVFPHALVTCSIDGSPATITQSAKITITKSIQKVGGLGSNLAQQAAAGECKFAFAATLGFTDATFHALFLGGTAPTGAADPASYEFEIDATNGTAYGSGERRLKLTLTACQMNGLNETTSVGGLTFVEVSGHGLLSECYTVDNIASGSW